jgi:hypothetical protein
VSSAEPELEPDDENEIDDTHTPAILDHCAVVYKAMAERAEQKTEGLVYEGFLTNLFRELGINQPYYTHITRRLKNMDCIRQLRRGGGTAPSVWMLLQEPSLALFDGSSGHKAEILQALRDINRRLVTAEGNVTRLGAMYQDATDRIKTLEDKINADS